MTGGVAGVICWLLYAYLVVLILHVVFSWVPRPPEPILPLVRGVHRLVEPLAGPVRRAIPPVRLGGMGLDLSILVLFFAVILLQRAFGCA